MLKLILEKAEGPEIKLPAFIESLKKQENSRKTSISVSLTMLKLLTVWITTDCEKLLEMGIPDCLTCLLRNLYCGSRSNRHGATDRFKIGKEVQQGCVLSLCLFNLHAVSVQFSYSVVSNSL